MSQPLFGRQGSAKVDKFLSDISIRYSNLDYVFPHVLPMVKVKEKTGLIPKYGKETLRILGKVVTGVYLSGTLRAPGARAKGVEFTYNQGQYICAEHSLEKDIPWDYYKNVDSPYEPTRDATAAVKDLLQLEQEFALATVLANITTIGNSSPTYKWDNAAQGTPVTDLENAVKSIQLATGRTPNVLVLSLDAFWALKNHPQFRDQIKYTNGGQVSNEDAYGALKTLLNVKEVYVGTAIFNNAAVGEADNIQPIWSKNAYLFYRTPSATIMEPTFGATFCDVPDVVDGWPEVDHKRDMIRDSVSYDQNIIEPKCGFRIAALS